MKRQAALTKLALGNIDSYTPTATRPLRRRSRHLAHDTHIEPHLHPWAQFAYCARGLIQVTVSSQSGAETTYIVPPSRAFWIPPGAVHAVTILQTADLSTLYVDPTLLNDQWYHCRMLVVSPLLRELILAVDSSCDEPLSVRESALMTLLLDEMAHAGTQPMGVPLPHPEGGDRRLRAVCEAVLRNPTQHATLACWAADAGASERTMARRFRKELGISYQKWRQQVLFSHALPMLAKGTPVGEVAAMCGYASGSAFSAMFRLALGETPRELAKIANKVSHR